MIVQNSVISCPALYHFKSSCPFSSDQTAWTIFEFLLVLLRVKIDSAGGPDVVTFVLPAWLPSRRSCQLFFPLIISMNMESAIASVAGGHQLCWMPEVPASNHPACFHGPDCVKWHREPGALSGRNESGAVSPVTLTVTLLARSVPRTCFQLRRCNSFSSCGMTATAQGLPG